MSDQAEALREFMRKAGVQTPEYQPLGAEPDWKALFDTVKAELGDAVKNGKLPFEVKYLSSQPDLIMRGIIYALDRMEQAETFARVRSGFGKIEGGE